MEHAKVTKRGGRKPLIEEGTLSLGARNFINEKWSSLVVSVHDTADESKKGYTVEVGRKQGC